MRTSPRLAEADRTLQPFALAAALGGRDCEIYTDVDGVYTADPRVVSHTKKTQPDKL